MLIKTLEKYNKLRWRYQGGRQAIWTGVIEVQAEVPLFLKHP
jgi:hypothetical protein